MVYSIIADKDLAKFEINSETGAIRSSERLTGSSYRFQVMLACRRIILQRLSIAQQFFEKRKRRVAFQILCALVFLAKKAKKTLFVPFKDPKFKKQFFCGLEIAVLVLIIYP